MTDMSDVDPSDYHRRLKQILNNEIRLQNREANISKRSSRFHSNLLGAKEAIDRQHRDFGKLRKTLMERGQELDRRYALGEALSRLLEATRQHNADMEAQLLRHTTEAKQRSNELMECMHTLKQATGTYINHKELPARLKGITVVRSADGDAKWIPFDLDGNDTNGLHTLWRCLHSRSDNASKWRQLLADQEVPAPVTPGANDRTKAKATSRCSNVVPTSIIEIDLTSPTNGDS